MMYAGKQPKVKSDQSDKVNNKKYVLKRLWDYLYFYKTKFFLAIFLTVVANVLSLVGPFLTGQTINAMTDGVDFDKVYLFAGLMILFYGISALLNYLLAVAMVKISQSVVYKMRKDLFAKLNRVKISYFDQNQTGDIISKMSYDIDTINTSLATDVVNIFTSSVTVVISFAMMIIMSPILVLVFVITLPISIVITKVLSKLVKKQFRIRNRKLGELNGFAEEMITGQRTIQSYVQETSILEKFDKINEETTDASYKAGYLASTVGPSINFVSNLSVALVGVFGGILYFMGNLSLGNLTSFTLYSRRFSGPINQMSNIIADIQSALAAAERVFRVIDEDEEQADDINALNYQDVKGHISLKDVSFGYLENQLVLKNVSLEASQGQVIAIVGPTGAGKTTLVNLLMRFYELDQGEILLDGKPITSLTRTSLRRSYSMVLQDTWIFHGTVFENISYGNGNVSRLEVEEAAKKARIHSFIKHLPDGYDTLLTDEGLNISKGQKTTLSHC